MFALVAGRQAYDETRSDESTNGDSEPGDGFTASPFFSVSSSSIRHQTGCRVIKTIVKGSVMSRSDKLRTKQIGLAQRALGDHARVENVSIGYGGSHPTAVIWTGLGVALALQVLLVLTTGGAFFLGGMGILLVVLGVRRIFGKPCWVVATDTGLALMSVGGFYGQRPKAVLARSVSSQWQAIPAADKWINVRFGPETAWVRGHWLKAIRT